jgi:hypothetical protein
VAVAVAVAHCHRRTGGSDRLDGRLGAQQVCASIQWIRTEWSLTHSRKWPDGQ